MRNLPTHLACARSRSNLELKQAAIPQIAEGNRTSGISAFLDHLEA